MIEELLEYDLASASIEDCAVLSARLFNESVLNNTIASSYGGGGTSPSSKEMHDKHRYEQKVAAAKNSLPGRKAALSNAKGLGAKLKAGGRLAKAKANSSGWTFNAGDNN